eukprot:gnl/TRDRNA2_/TRDRNA2_148670_c1_seq1.p1 gnl/TRDRNA2_/TRDRNA2_148670_c1~~gnl/TRDRNA2_/TRDRNA2_148670_c1_seq1.p1  ORF type:complete len:110 (+),score=21.93 gnl/TRDRNA2_/TRDRNA2_148670_c1_seq1:62-391(+)
MGFSACWMQLAILFLGGAIMTIAAETCGGWCAVEYETLEEACKKNFACMTCCSTCPDWCAVKYETLEEACKKNNACMACCSQHVSTDSENDREDGAGKSEDASLGSRFV